MISWSRIVSTAVLRLATSFLRIDSASRVLVLRSANAQVNVWKTSLKGGGMGGDGMGGNGCLLLIRAVSILMRALLNPFLAACLIALANR